jgi:hypothetical protein
VVVFFIEWIASKQVDEPASSTLSTAKDDFFDDAAG